MYVYEEMIDGKKLTEIINTTHENVKYLPGHKLPPNVVSYKVQFYDFNSWKTFSSYQKGFYFLRYAQVFNQKVKKIPKLGKIKLVHD